MVDSGHSDTGAITMDFRILPAGFEMNQRDFVFKTVSALDRGQLLNIHLQAVLADGNLPFGLGRCRFFAGQAMRFQDQGHCAAMGKGELALQRQGEFAKAMRIAP